MKKPKHNFDETTLDKEFNKAHGKPAQTPLLLIAVFVAVAVLMFAVAIVSAAGAGRSLSREVSVPGRVVDIVGRSGATGPIFYYPVVEFYLPDESLQRVQVSEGSSSPAYVEGQDVTVLYDPAQPSSARIKSAQSGMFVWIVPIVTGILGIAFSAAALLAAWLARTG